jgi:Putative peptidoglycan binding domain
LRLRQAGIRILTTKEERFGTPGAPYLYINVNVMLRSEGLAVFNIFVELNQDASLKTDGSLATVSTWNVGVTGSVGKQRLSDIRNFVRDSVDNFINAYLSVNPRPAPSVTPSTRHPRVESEKPPLRSYLDLGRPSSPTPPAEPASPRRDLVRQVQERLQIVGFNPGTIDGTMGPQTQQALRWFQNTKGLRSTGDLDEPTLNTLGVR